MLATEALPKNIIVVGEYQICLGLVSAERATIVRDRRRVVLVASVTGLWMEEVCVGVTLFQVPCSCPLPRYGSFEGRESQYVYLEITSQF